MRLAAAIFVFTCLASAEERAVKLVNVPSDRAFQEMATVLRTVTDVRNVRIGSEHQVLHLEAIPDNLNAAEWLTHQLDKPAGWHPSSQDKGNPAAREYRLPATEPDSVLRLYYLPEAITPPAMQDSVVALRTVLDLRKGFSYSPLHLLAFRGTASEVDSAEWLLNAMNLRAASETYTLTDGIPPGMVRVFPLPLDTDPERVKQLMVELRSKPIGIMKVYGRRDPLTIAVRGTAAQVEQAEKLISSIK